MSKKTIKELELIIEDLEKRLIEQNNINLELNKTIGEMQERADNSFLNSALHKQLLRETRILKANIESKDRIINHLEKDITDIKIENSRLNGAIGHYISEKNELIIEIDNLNKKIELDNELYKDNETVIKKLNETMILSARKNKIIDNLENEVEQLKVENEKLRSNGNTFQKIKNERNAGRKEKFTEEEKATVKMLRFQNKSYRAIAKELNCSVATVHKIINEQN